MGTKQIMRRYFNVGFSTLLTLVHVTTPQGIYDHGTSGVYALPEISMKAHNGTVLAATPNSPVKLSQDLGYVEMTCTADYPVKWEYLVNNKTIPVLDLVYRRLVRNISDFNNPKGNRFMCVVTLRGLFESQTGKYLCRLYNEKLSNNSYSVASYYDVFVPGNRTFNAISSVSFVNKTTAAYVNIHCPVTDPDLHVRLYKLNEQHFSKTREALWKPIYANYEPTDGFKLLAGLGRELLGTYNCTADNGASMISISADLTEKDHYLSLSSPSLQISVNASSCRENYKFVQYLRSKRLECYCQDSFGLFMNTNYEFENRQANCFSTSLSLLQRQLANCSDWRLEEFIKSSEESRDVCFRGVEESTATKFQGDAVDGTGSRPIIIVKGKAFPNGDSLRAFPFTVLSITYNGFVDWAGDFKLGVCREDVCRLENNNDVDNNDSGNNSTGKGRAAQLEYIENEPTRRQYFPLAHHQAMWNDLIINGTDVKLVYVLQAHSLSYAWFPYSTVKIEWEQEKVGMSMDMTSSAFEGDRKMMSTSGSNPALKVFKITCYAQIIFYAFLFIY